MLFIWIDNVLIRFKNNNIKMSNFIKNEYPKKDVLKYSLLICQGVTENQREHIDYARLTKK